jgi:hypothetical protein
LRDASFSSLSYDNNPVKALLHGSTLVAGEGLIGIGGNPFTTDYRRVVPGHFLSAFRQRPSASLNYWGVRPRMLNQATAKLAVWARRLINQFPRASFCLGQ